MTTAKLCSIVGNMFEVIITHGSGVQTKMYFKTADEARHYFMDQLGWYEDQGVWFDHEAILPSFVPVPRFTHGNYCGCLDKAGDWPMTIWTIRCSVAGIQGTFEAFYYQVQGVEFMDFDPVLSIASPFPLKIGAIGAWPSTYTAVEAAKAFYDQLLETYGHEYFRRVVDENIRRELRADEARHKVSLDAARAESVD